MRHDLRRDPVAERRDDVSAVGVVLGVGGEDDLDVERQTDRESADLDVLFLENVQEPHLDPGLEIGKLVDREDAAVGTGQEAEVHRQLVGQQMPTSCRLDRVDVAEDVGDRDVRRRELFDEAQLARQPGDRRAIAALGDQLAAVLGERLERVVVDLAARDDRNLFIEQRDELAQDAALRLPAQSQQNEIVARKDGVDELRQDRLFVAQDAGKQRRAVLQQADQVLPHLVFDGALAAGRTRPLRSLQFTEGRR